MASRAQDFQHGEQPCLAGRPGEIDGSGEDVEMEASSKGTVTMGAYFEAPMRMLFAPVYGENYVNYVVVPVN